MNLEDQILCLCTRQHFDDGHAARLRALCAGRDVDWEAIFETAEAHRVSPLVHANLLRLDPAALGLPAEIRKRFKTAYIHNVLLVQGTRRALESVLSTCTEDGVEVMLVKGAALNVAVYNEPWYTISGDVDLIVRADEATLMASDRRRVIDQIYVMNKQRSKFQANIEYDFQTHHDITMNDVLSVKADHLWERAEKIQLLGHNVFVLPPEEQLLAAAINSCRKRFLRLKCLLDLVTIVEKYPQLDWLRIITTARRWQAQTILFTALSVAERTLGCSVPPYVRPALGVHPTRRWLIRTSMRALFRRPLAAVAATPYQEFLGRRFSWALLLTYATYPSGLLLRKTQEVWRAWRHPPPKIPPPVDSEGQIQVS